MPEPEVPHRAAPQEWSGVESPYQRYAITLSFNAGRQMQPEQFEFVNPNIGIRGWSGSSNSGLSFGVELFQRASTARDIRIDYREPPEVIEEDQEYLAAEVSGEKAITRWKVYIRFQREQPANAKAPSTP